MTAGGVPVVQPVDVAVTLRAVQTGAAAAGVAGSLALYIDDFSYNIGGQLVESEPAGDALGYYIDALDIVLEALNDDDAAGPFDTAGGVAWPTMGGGLSPTPIEATTTTTTTSSQGATAGFGANASVPAAPSGLGTSGTASFTRQRERSFAGDSSLAVGARCVG
ncbi:hypothetical protein MMPV_007064 [Pyropia vietnamensis]